MTKKNILIASFVFSTLLLVVNVVGTYSICGGHGGECVDNLYIAVITCEFFLPLFLLSLVVYKMRDEIFAAWINFAKWWVPLSVLAVFVAPTYSHDWMFPLDKGRVSLGMSILFLLISLILITWKWFTLRKTK